MQCPICHHHCELEHGKYGKCGTKRLVEGKIESDNDWRILAIALDPIEKKPLYHFCPGTNILSIGTFGCNLKCPWCQNHALVAHNPANHSLNYGSKDIQDQLANQLLDQAIESKAMGIAFTYNEPLLWHPTITVIAKHFKAAGLKTVMVTNGCATPEVINSLLPLIDAWNVDLKTVIESDYKRIGGDYFTVINTIKSIIAYGAHVEVTYLVVPKFNENLNFFKQLAQLIFDLGVPVLHLSRYFPSHHYPEPPTAEQTMRDGFQIVTDELKRLTINKPHVKMPAVYLGNCSWVHYSDPF